MCFNHIPRPFSHPGRRPPRRRNVVDAQGKGWTHDPYDAGCTKGVLMNHAETEQFDESFPAHPLSMVRLMRNILATIN